jgi:flagellar protein FliO/FliZ
VPPNNPGASRREIPDAQAPNSKEFRNPTDSLKTDPLFFVIWNSGVCDFRAFCARPFTSVTRWLLVVVGCVVLATAQPMSAASDAPSTAGPRSSDTVIYPKSSAERPAGEPATRESDGSRPLVVLVALILAGAGAWLLIQRRNAGPLSNRGQRKLQVDETRALGNRQYLVVASYEGKKFLLGVTPGQIQMLTDLDGTTAGEKKP